MTSDLRHLLTTAVISAAALTGCEVGGPGADGLQGVGVTTADLRVGESPEFSIDGPGHDEPPFHEIASITRLADGNIAVADQAPRIVIIDSDGAPVRSFGTGGDGPGEFRSVTWVRQIHGDSLMVYDAVLQRASLFSMDGEYARTLTAEVRPGGDRPPMLLGASPDGDLLAGEPLMSPSPEGGSGIVRPEMIVSRHDSEGVFLDSLMVLPGNERGVMSGIVFTVPFLRTTTVALDGDRILVATGDEFEVAIHDRDGALVRTATAAVEPRPVTEELIERAEVANPLIPLLPTRLPAVSDFIVDPLGRLWVGPYAADVEEPHGPWKVFDAEAEPIHDVEMPTGFRPLDIDERSLIGIRVDDLGVEHVRVYPLIESDGN